MKLDAFRWTKDNFNFEVKNDESEGNVFDDMLRSKWKEAEKNGVLRYTLNMNESKVLEGQYGFFAQLNVDRGQNRREPEKIKKMDTPFDPVAFNFMKIKSEEILFDVGDGDGNDVIAVNVSPFAFGHSIFIPERFEGLPQVVTESCLSQVVRMFLCSKSPFLRACFNSLCADASVNNLHWHFYYLEKAMHLEKIETQKFSGPLDVLANYPAKGFCLNLSSFNKNPEKFAKFAFKIINYLQKKEIPHNVYITRARKSTETDENVWDDVRMYIWARTPCSIVRDTSKLTPAVCELFGHLVITSEELYQNLTESDVAEILDQITSKVFSEVKENLRELITDSAVSR